MSKVPSLPSVNVSPSISKKEISKAETIDDTIPSWRRGGSLRTRTGSRETPTIEEGVSFRLGYAGLLECIVSYFKYTSTYFRSS